MDTNTPAPSTVCRHRCRQGTPGSRLRGDAPPERIAYTTEALQALLVRLQGLSAVQVIVEATGGLELRLMTELWAAQIAVARINPERVRAFAKASGQLAKTDALDARRWPSLAPHCGQRPRPYPRLTPKHWRPKSAGGAS